MKILFLSADSSDYLNISILHGLKSLENVEVIEYPKSEISYNTCKEDLQQYLRGNGFTLFFNLEDKNVKRFHLKHDELVSNKFDLIIFGDIKSSFGIYIELFPFLNYTRIAILDGSDDPCLFGNHGYFWRKPYLWLIPKPQNNFLYFKREWIPSAINNARFLKLLPKFIADLIPQNKNLRKISFSIPEGRIVSKLPTKTKLFPTHIVDDEVSLGYYGQNQTHYAFTKEQDYYEDIASSMFGITTKRAGWDCLRHYEIAANGTVICFKDLDKKPDNCAPHGLIPGINCISYSNYRHLMSQIESISESKYLELQNASLIWIKGKTTIEMARFFLDSLGHQSNKK